MNANRLIQLASRRKMAEADFEKLAKRLAVRRKGLLFDDERLGLYAESLEDSRFINHQIAPPDCLTCGACCAFFQQIVISIADSTPRSLAWEVADPDEQTTHWLKRRPGDARCIALEGRVGEQAQCAIYELRPTACRAFEAGSDRCRALRRMYGLEPALSKAERDRQLITLKENQGDSELEVQSPLSEISDARSQIDFLRELVAFNLSAIDAIVREVMRLESLFKARNADQSAAICRQAIENLTVDAAQIAGEKQRLDWVDEYDRLNDGERHDLLNCLLIIGNHSQEKLESAAHYLAGLGELAFDILGMKENFLSSP